METLVESVKEKRDFEQVRPSAKSEVWTKGAHGTTLRGHGPDWVRRSSCQGKQKPGPPPERSEPPSQRKS